jgi:protocatechuate 3,4-dioxygenase beta subunit
MPTRRNFIAGLAAVAVFPPLARSATLLATPRQTEGPFYPDQLPLDQDNDLILSGDRAAARGEITHMSGRVLDVGGHPVKNALVEIWQVDSNGVYLHSADAHAKRDANFQGYGRFETGANGEYRFRTIKPVSYPGRTPHIHFKVSLAGNEVLTTQCYVRGHPLNRRDGLLNSLRGQEREAVLVAFIPSDARPGELKAHFDIVMRDA